MARRHPVLGRITGCGQDGGGRNQPLCSVTGIIFVLKRRMTSIFVIPKTLFRAPTRCQQNTHCSADRHRLRLPARGGNWNHERDAGFGDRTHEGDRSSSCSWSNRGSHSASVPGGIDRAEPDWRGCGCAFLGSSESYLVGQTLGWPIAMSLDAVVVAAMFFGSCRSIFRILPGTKKRRCSTPLKLCGTNEGFQVYMKIKRGWLILGGRCCGGWIVLSLWA